MQCQPSNLIGTVIDETDENGEPRRVLLRPDPSTLLVVSRSFAGALKARHPRLRIGAAVRRPNKCSWTRETR